MWGLQPPLLRGVIAIALVACVGLAAAQTGRRGVGDTDASAMDETTGSVARPGRRAGAELALSDEQRGRIYEGVMRIADAPVAAAPAPALADALPSGVPLQDLPASLTREIPLVRGHIREVRRPHRGGRSGEPPGRGHDPALQAAALAFPPTCPGCGAARSARTQVRARFARKREAVSAFTRVFDALWHR